MPSPALLRTKKKEFLPSWRKEKANLKENKRKIVIARNKATKQSHRIK